jgi:hypothetical protein
MQVTIKGYVHANQVSRYCAEQRKYVTETQIEIYPFDMSGGSADRVLVGEQEFTVEISETFDMRAGLVKNIDREIKKTQAAAEKRVTELKAQKQSLPAIENNPS